MVQKNGIFIAFLLYLSIVDVSRKGRQETEHKSL